MSTLFTAKMTAEIYATAIGAAVQPLRAVAMDRAEKNARERIEADLKKLAEEFGGDAQKMAPYPNSLRTTREAYKAGVRFYHYIRSITKAAPSEGYVSRRMGDPEMVVPNPERIEKAIADSRDMAAGQYDAFVAKLINKAGEHVTATLEGDHVWGESFLTVTFAGDKPAEVWKTRQIWNVSKLGLHFPQWPSRKVRGR